MKHILKLKQHNQKKEIDFELRYLKSLSIKQRFEMMIKKTKEILCLLEKSGHRRSFEISKRTDLIKMKRAAARPQDLEDLKYLKKLKRL